MFIFYFLLICEAFVAKSCPHAETSIPLIVIAQYTKAKSEITHSEESWAQMTSPGGGVCRDVWDGPTKGAGAICTSGNCRPATGYPVYLR